MARVSSAHDPIGQFSWHRKVRKHCLATNIAMWLSILKRTKQVSNAKTNTDVCMVMLLLPNASHASFFSKEKKNRLWPKPKNNYADL